ncbi:MAG: type VI secretion system protein TssL, long form [Pikeienuella sp.]
MTAPADSMDDDGPGIILPTPGRKPPVEEPRKPALKAPAPGRFPVAEITRGLRLEGGAIPAMAAEAAPLLNFAHTLRHRTAAPDMGALKRETVAAVKEYEQSLGRAGILPEQARAAHYVICATLDDVIRNTDWGENWSVDGLVSSFHHDVTGGDKVFELLEHFRRTPSGNRDLLLLIYLCLSLGFEGRTRVSRRGALELAHIRDDLYRLLRSQFGAFERDLSPAWKGEDARHRPLRSSRLFWLIVGALALLLAALFALYSTLLYRGADKTLEQMATLPPGATPTLFIPPPPPPPAPAAEETPKPAPPPELPVVARIEAFIGFLQPEVEEGLVRLYRDGDAVLVRIANSGVFPPGSAAIEPDFIDIFDRIGQALAAEDFDVTVLGHTDNQPIRSSAFPSNFHLSTARANAVRDMLVAYTGPRRIDIRGEADSRPVADNATPEGREANRRTEILVRDAGARVPPSLLEIGGVDISGEASE